MTAVEPQVAVVYILGAGRSGSTLLGRLLGELAGSCFVGELRSVWTARLKQDSPCGCGRPLRICPNWNEAFEEGFGSWTLADRELAEIRGWQVNALRFRNVRKLLRPEPPMELKSDLSNYREALMKLYGGISRAWGCAVIVDSSKRPADAALVSGTSGMDCFLVHLVRDPRGVANSSSKAKRHIDHPRFRTPVRRAPRSAGIWLAINVAAEIVRRKRPRSMRLRMEDFAKDPADAVRSIAGEVGLADPSIPLTDNVARLKVHHTAWGNPGRFDAGDVAIQLDESWRRAMPLKNKALVTAIALPLIAKYGYLRR